MILVTTTKYFLYFSLYFLKLSAYLFLFKSILRTYLNFKRQSILLKIPYYETQ